jgi:sulfate adenylyltransferase subunit 1
MIVDATNQPEQSQEIDLMVCWLSEKPLALRGKYQLKHNSNELRCIITEVSYKVNINTTEEIHDDLSVGLNEIARITIKTTKPLFYDAYKKNRDTGSLILIDEATNNVVGAGMIL